MYSLRMYINIHALCSSSRKLLWKVFLCLDFSKDILFFLLNHFQSCSMLVAYILYPASQQQDCDGIHPGSHFYTNGFKTRSLYYILISCWPSKISRIQYNSNSIMMRKRYQRSKWCYKTYYKTHMLILKMFQMSTRNWQFNVVLKRSDQEAGRLMKPKHRQKKRPKEYHDSCKELNITQGPTLNILLFISETKYPH